MKKVVVYKSSTGFTKTYAEWISARLNCEAVDIKAAKESIISKYECVIYGGWIMGNMIMGLDKIKKMNPRNLVVYAVGSSLKTVELEDTIKEQNHLGNMPFFYMEGGFHFEKLNFFVRTMLKAMKKSVAKKKNKTETDLYMEKNLGTSFDNSDIKNIEPLVKYVAELK